MTSGDIVSRLPQDRPKLLFLLDAIDMAEEDWVQLPVPIPLFLEEIRKALFVELGFPIGATG